MKNFEGQILKNELKRRWKAVRNMMAKKEIDCLVMQNTNQYLGGYVHYFTGNPAETYGVSVIFLLDDEMSVISHGGQPSLPLKPKELLLGVREHIRLPYIPTLNFTNTMDAKAVVKIIRESKVKSVGFVGGALMSAVFYEYIKKNLNGINLSDATSLVDEIKAVKSKEEIRLIKKTIELQDKVFTDTLALIHPGVKEHVIISQIKRQAANMGSMEGLVMIGSAPSGTPAIQGPKPFPGRTIKYGDQVCIMIEVNGPGGFYGEIGRTVCIGKVPKPLLEVWRDAVNAQDKTANLMNPGAEPKELFNKHNKLLTNLGYPIEGRLYSHSQGYDMVERPGIRAEETMTIKANMNMVIHPVTMSKEAYAFCCDNYIITEAGAVRLHKTPREVFTV